MTKTIEDINLHTWFVERELSFVPAHFIKSTTALTDESRAWILEKLTGRFSLYNSGTAFVGACPAFEDPKEAMFYELTWG